MSYQKPPAGTVLPAQPNVDFPNPGPTRDSSKFQEWYQAFMQDFAYRQNVLRVADYLTQFTGSWLVQYYSGRMPGPTGIEGDPNAVPLKPPAAMIVLVTDYGFDMQESGQLQKGPDDSVILDTGPRIPVCAVPAYQKLPA